MGKAESFLDWELSFKKKDVSNKDKDEKNYKNSLGIQEQTFREFLKKWKEKNL